MAEEKKSISGSVLIVSGFVGSVLGAAAGLLLAPQSGKKTREKLQETYETVSEKMNTVVNKIDEKLPDVLTRVGSEITEVPDQVKGELASLKKGAEETLSRVVDKGTALFQDLRKTATSTMEEGKKKITKGEKK